MQTESHDGTAYQPQAEMAYNGLGQRQSMTAHAGGLSLATTYVLDSEQNAAPLMATANGQTTYYLYGLEPVAERAASWNYYLRDGLGSVRKIADSTGEIVLECSYTPWGDVLSQNGTLTPAHGYLGGWVDAATGLIYVGNGQYYDPATRRFLTRDAQLGNLNPYLPGRGDPTGLLIGPLALVVLAKRRKGGKGNSKVGQWVVLLLVGLVVGLMVTGCVVLKPTPTSLPMPVPTSTLPNPEVWKTRMPETPSAPLESPVPPADGCSTMMFRSLTEWEKQYGQAIASAAQRLLNRAGEFYIWGATTHPDDENADWPPPRLIPKPTSTWGFGDSINLRERMGKSIPIICADVADLSYKNGGLDLVTSYPDWYEDDKRFPSGDPNRNVGAMKILVREKGQLHEWDDNASPELGDMIFFSDSSHMGIVAEICGNKLDPAQIFVIQASYSQGVINKMSLAEWQQGKTPVSFGHPIPE